MTSAPAISGPAESALRPGMTYGDWIALYYSSPRLNLELRRRLRSLPRHPLISILLPVYNPKIKFLAAAIASVRAQLYTNWQLCIADDASTDSRIRPFLQQVAQTDARIALTCRETNGHISAASNSALALASGEWCALLDQDDLLPAHALAFVACEINAHPDAGLIYSDEDKIDEQEVRSDPFFKPDWNPELFLSQNYINHLGVYRAEILRELGGFREGFDGSQDYDLALRFVERLHPDQVRHIRRVLYHWRALPGSLAAAIDAKPLAKEGARRALTQHLQRRAIPARVEACRENPGRHRVIYDVPAPAPLVSIVIPTRDRVDLLRACIDGLRQRTDYEAIELIVVDNGSSERSARNFLTQLSQENGTQILDERGPFNSSRLINRGAGAARGEILAFLHSGIEVEEPDWLREMVSQVLQAGVGAVGARLWSDDGTLHHGGVILGLGGMVGHAFEGVGRGYPGYFDRLFLPQDCSAVTGACMLVRKKVFAEAGGFDEKNFAVSFNDIDFCLRLREREMRIIWTPYANLIHHEAASHGGVRSAEEEAQFFREAASLWQKWGARLLRDPFYNPNFSFKTPGFEIAFPPRDEAATVPL